MSFELDITKFAEATKQSVETVSKKVIFKLNELVVLRTPVDTGRARGGWVASIDRPSEMDKPLDKSGFGTVSEANNTADKSIGRIYWLTNNVVYIRSLEYGRSNQAPQGMVRLSLQEIQNAFQSFVAREKHGG
jgi:hypothetical protein